MLTEGQKVLVGARGLNEVQRVFSSGKIEVTLGERTVRTIATLHPAYLLRTPGAKRLAWRDLLAVRAALDA